MTCRDEVLTAMRRLRSRHGRDVFGLDEIVQEVRAVTSSYTESTVRTHVTSRMCKQAPAHHGTVYGDLDRAGRGLYRLRSD
jgi:hypothetical protein